MAFWGIEVKPGKPYTHHYDESRGRLRICQATLGNGKSASKTMVQCNVGNKTPIFLCSLIPEKLETCPLELEFEEDEEVIFSVLGQKSVHLSGFHIGRSGRNMDGDETDLYGEDIADTDTSRSSDSYDDEDEYESDFINDDVEMYPHSPRRKSKVVIEEIIEDEKPSNGNSSDRRLLKKKHQLSDSDDGDDSKCQLVVKQNNPSIFDSEDDGFPTPFSGKDNVAKGPEETSDLDGKAVDEDKKRKLDAIGADDITAVEAVDTLLPSEIGAENTKLKKKKKARDGKPLETVTRASAEERVNNKLDNDQEKEVKEQNVESGGIETDAAENDGKRKKKTKKEKKGNKSESGTAVPVERTEEEVKGNDEALNNNNMDQAPVSTEPEKLPTDSEMVDYSVLPASAQENSAKSAKKKNRKRKSKDDNSQENENNAEPMEPLKSKAVEQLSNVTPGVEADRTPDVDKRDVKKKKRNNEKDSASNNQLAAHRKSDKAKVDSRLHKVHNFPNGLIIEDLAVGKPNGKEASDGSKVFVNYIGKLKNGTIFDSNVGQRPFKFRLGAGQVIKGWDVGVKGMRVGDKRRLTIPPSFGYGEKGAGKKIPGNSWLVFDVELVNVQ